MSAGWNRAFFELLPGKSLKTCRTNRIIRNPQRLPTPLFCVFLKTCSFSGPHPEFQPESRTSPGPHLEENMVLKDQIALITGASSGIGYATAVAMAREGARVGVNFHKNKEGAERAVAEIRKAGGEAEAIRADVTSASEVQAMVDAVRRRWGRIDILVNNAGDLLARRMLPEMTEDYWDQIMALNLKSVFLCVKAVWEEMAARKGGNIINVSSIAGRNGGGPGSGAYASAKGGMITYTKSLAKELAPHGVRVNAVAPGVIATPYHERYSPPEVFQKFLASIPLGRAGTSEEVASVIVFLASPAASYIVGETIEMNGGMLMD